MKKILFIFILSLLSTINILSAQIYEEDDDNNYETLKFRIKYTFVTNVFYIYKCSIQTEINRMFPDSSLKTITRNEEVYITLRAPSNPKNGFVELNTGIDSILYEFNDGHNKYKWWSLSDDDPLPDNFDFYKTSTILGQYFYTTISPYFEVALIKGEILDKARENIDEVADTNLKFILKKSLSEDNLKLYTDLNKNVLKNGRFGRDSSWKSDFSIQIEGVKYTCDTADVKFYLYDGKNYHVKANVPYMKASYEEKTDIVGYENLISTVDSTSYSKGFWDVTVSPRGQLQTAQGEFNTNANIYLNNDIIKDNINTKIKFELLRTHKWKN